MYSIQDIYTFTYISVRSHVQGKEENRNKRDRPVRNQFADQGLGSMSKSALMWA